ncbi:MAG: hypothetical protein WBE24_13820, partial [Candidatus Acidiferrum sp.]
WMLLPRMRNLLSYSRVKSMHGAYLGDAYLQLGRLEEAREILSHTSGVSLNDPKFQYFLAELYLKLGMRQEACREHEALKQLDPSLAEEFARLLGSPPGS